MAWYNFVAGGVVAAIIIYGAYFRGRQPPEIHFGRATRIKSGTASRRKMPINWPLIYFAAFAVIIIAVLFVLIQYEVIIQFRVFCCGDRPN